VNLHADRMQRSKGFELFLLGGVPRPSSRNLPVRTPAALAYEQEAARYGLLMLHEADITNLDDWFSAHSACDQAYLLHY
jgi:hypothetical protein